MERPEVSFRTAGTCHAHNGSHIIINQAYVQYIPPIASPNLSTPSMAEATPILFVHGGGLTGSMWESTPDRRVGWAIMATRPPYHRPVYCIDAVDSGRSQRCPDSVRSGQVEHRSAADAWARFRFGPEGEDQPWPDSQFPLEYMDRLLASQSARRRGGEQYEAEARGLRDAIDEIGACDVVAHSNGCAVAILALLDMKPRSRIRCLILIEPGPPHTLELDHLETIRSLVVWGDHIPGHRMWEQIRPHYEKMKGRVTVWDLPTMGITGNSHFPMHDRNSEEIGVMILDWLNP
jgi:pimeloyl-ACP methyl ester carboxylesterase